MDIAQQDSAELLRTAMNRCRNLVGTQISVDRALMAGLVAGCRDRDDLFSNLFSARDVRYHLAPNADRLRL